MSSEGSLDDPGVMEVTGRVLIGTIIALTVVLVLVFLFHIYANWLWHRRQQAAASNLNRRPQDHHLHTTGVTVLRRGLDAAFLSTLPLFQFHPKHFKDALECSVCLSELEQGEKTRILPKCSHVFHAECIDMWFHSHSTCPICRNPVSEQTQVSVETLLENHHTQQIDNGDSHTFPTNVLFWGDETEVSTLTSQLVEASNNNNNQTPALSPFEPPSSSSSSSSSECTDNDRLKPDLVIDIPRHAAEEEEEEEGEKSPIMRSLRRILSSSTRFNPFSPRNNVSQQAQS